MYLYCDTWNVYFIFCELWRILSFSVETWSIDLRLLSKGRELLCSKPSVRWTSLLKRQPVFLWTKSETCSILSSSGVMDIVRPLVRNCLRPATVYYKYVQFLELKCHLLPTYTELSKPGYQAFLSHGVGEGSNRQRKAWHKGLYCSLPPPHSVTSVSVRISQSELFPAVMSTLHKFCMHQRWQRRLFLISFGFPRIFAQFTSKMFTEYGKCVATVPLFAETFNIEVSNVLCEKPIILVELLFELRIVVTQDSEDGK